MHTNTRKFSSNMRSSITICDALATVVERTHHDYAIRRPGFWVAVDRLVVQACPLRYYRAGVRCLYDARARPWEPRGQGLYESE